MPAPDLYELPNSDVFFKQRRFLRRHQYMVVNDGVNVTENWVSGSTKYKVAFEDIPRDASEVTVSSKGYLIFAAFLAVLAIATAVMMLFGQNVQLSTPLIWAFLAGCSGALFFLSRQHFLVFQSPEKKDSLILFKDNPSREELEQFIIKLQKRKNDYLRKMYVREDGLPLADSIRNLTWLKEQGVITPEEYEHMKSLSLGTGPWGSAPPSPN